MRRPLAAAALALATTLPATAAEPPLRIAAITGAEGPCAAAAASVAAAERAWHAHLAKRLERPVLRCPVVDRAAAAKALADGRLDLALLDPASYRPVATQVRAVLTSRPKAGPSRVPVVVSTIRGAPAAGLASLKGQRAVYAGHQTTSLALPRRVLADHGAPSTDFGSEIVAADPAAAVAALRAGRADVMLLHASAHQRLCRADRPGQAPCADLKEIFRGRSRPAAAYAVRRDMSDPLRFRLVGVMLPLHLEAPAAFAHIRTDAPDIGELEPTEADALGIGPPR